MRAAGIIILVLMGMGLHAQTDFQKVDSTSYALYLKEDWKGLVAYSQEVKDFDYYHLNMRMGMAFYELGKWYRAEKYFKKAWANNDVRTLPKEYLFWIYSYTGRTKEASIIKNTLSEKIGLSLNEQEHKFFDSFYLEGGQKFSDIPDTVGNLNYGSVGFNLRPTRHWNIYQSYNRLNQEMSWGTYKQNQYWVLSNWDLRHSWKISGGLNYLNYQRSVYQRFDSTSVILHDEYFNELGSAVVVDSSGIYSTTYDGDFTFNQLVVQGSASKRFGNTSLTAQMVYWGQWGKPNYYEILGGEYNTWVTLDGEEVYNNSVSYFDSTLKNQPYFSGQFQWGMGVDYTFEFKPYCSLLLGAELQTVLNLGDVKSVISPYLSIQMGPKWLLGAYYTSKGNYPLSLFGGKTVLNGYDEVKNRVSATIRWKAGTRISLYGTLQYDEIIDQLTYIQYSTTGFFLGIKINL